MKTVYSSLSLLSLVIIRVLFVGSTDNHGMKRLKQLDNATVHLSASQMASCKPLVAHDELANLGLVL